MADEDVNDKNAFFKAIIAIIVLLSEVVVVRLSKAMSSFLWRTYSLARLPLFGEGGGQYLNYLGRYEFYVFILASYDWLGYDHLGVIISYKSLYLFRISLHTVSNISS